MVTYLIIQISNGSALQLQIEHRDFPAFLGLTDSITIKSPLDCWSFRFWRVLISSGKPHNLPLCDLNLIAGNLSCIKWLPSTRIISSEFGLLLFYYRLRSGTSS